MTSPRVPRLVTAFIVVAVALAGCVAAPSGSATVVPATAKDAAWGQAPAADPNVTLQPDVVLIGGGGASVKQVTADGFTWVLDANAPHVSDLKVGKIMFVTGSGVGRVIDLRHAPGVVGVTIAPVSITDVIQDGTFSVPKPVDLSQGAIGQVGEGSFLTNPQLIDEQGQDDIFPDPETPVDGVTPTPTPNAEPGAFIRGATFGGEDFTTEPAVDVPTPAIPKLPDNVQRPLMTAGKVATQIESKQGDFDLTRTWDKQGTGTDLYYEKEGLKIKGNVALKMDSPQATFDLKISGGKLSNAEFLLTGAASLHAELEASTTSGPAVKAASKALGMDMSFSIPVGAIFGIPFSVSVINTLKVELFLPGSAYVKGVGDYALNASLGFQYVNGSFKSLTGGSFKSDSSAKASTSIAVGISGVTVYDEVTFRIGIGMLGFTAGLDFGIVIKASVLVGAPIGIEIEGGSDPIEHCRYVKGYLAASWGVGYSIPPVVQKVINWFLKVFRQKPIASNHGEAHDSQDIAFTDQVYPESLFCR